MCNSVSLPSCLGKFLLLTTVASGLVLVLPQSATAQTCLQDEYNVVNKQKLNCSANDVRVAAVTNIRDLNGNALSTCIEGSTFSFVADFNVITTANAANAGGRDNIGLYFQTDPTKATALSGTCVDNIIAPIHACGSSGALGAINCGTSGYQEFDPSPDNCGDTSSSVNGNITDTIVVTNFLCKAPSGSTTLVLPNCTSWQTPGSSNLCVSNPPGFPYPAPPAAIPGSPSKCNCEVIPLPITPVTPSVIVQKACTTDQTPGPATFTQNPNTQTPTSCNVGNGTTTESGKATYTVAVTNTTGTSGITIDQICDSAYGTIYQVAGFAGVPCAAGTNGTASFGGCTTLDIPATGATTATCTFTDNNAQNELTTVTDIATVTGHADVDPAKLFGPTASNNATSVSVISTEVPSTATVLKDFVGTEAGCATVRYSVDVQNTSALDETESLSALNDSAYGDVTKCTNANCANTSGANGTLQVLGTTCGVTSGIGTLIGTTGAGALSASLATGAHYTCQFDAQFCSALDSNSCISNIDKVTATLKGDEASDVAFNQGGNTLTVKECFGVTVTSAP